MCALRKTPLHGAWPRFALGLALAVAAACQDEPGSPPATDHLRVSIAPLTLPGIGEATWSIAVDSAQGRVWSDSALTSGQFGDGHGGISYVGACDASANPHTVTLRLVSLRDTSGRALSSPGDFFDPSPIVRENVNCSPNADALVAFDVTLMRTAQQGFFDIAVDFEDVFCSAKLDCPAQLLNDPQSGQRRPTAVFGFACAAGLDQETWFYLSDVVLTCDDADPETPARSATIDGRDIAENGQHGPIAPLIFEWARYRGHETLQVEGGAVDKCYWNYAIGLDTVAMAGDTCTLTAVGTASGARLTGIPADSVMPLLTWQVPVWTNDTLCHNNALDAVGSGVKTIYSHRLPPDFVTLASTFEEYRCAERCAADLECNDGVACTTDRCDGGTCTHTTNDAACGDGDACSTDLCRPAQATANDGCVHAPSTLDCDDGQACTTDRCDPATGACAHAPADDGTPCDDHDACSAVDICQNGICTGAGAGGCDDHDPCSDDECAPGGGCTHTPNSASCDDGDACTLLDRCAAGRCAGIAIACDDHNACTADACDAGRCEHTPIAGTCDDGDACTSNDTCTDGDCAGTPITCDDHDACNGLETCDHQTGCVSNPAPACDDHDACNGLETCDPASGCKRGPPPDCADDNACSDDACDPQTGCTHAPHVGACDDGNACSDDDHCDGLTCVSGPADCDDHNVCTVDACGATGCTHVDDTSEPVINFAGVAADGIYQNAVTVNVTVAGPVLGPVSVTVDDQPYVPGTPISEPGFHVLDAKVFGCDGHDHQMTLAFRIDGTPPTIRATVTPPANGAGWHHTPAIVTFFGDDDMPDGLTVSDPVMIATAGENQIAHGVVTDASGRSAELDVRLDIDLTPPDITIDSPTGADENGIFLSGTTTLVVSGTFEADDLSGFARGGITSNRVPIDWQTEDAGPFQAEIQLLPGVNEIVVSAADVAGGVRAVLLRVNFDASAPHVFVQSPIDGVVTTESAISVAGIAMDETSGPTTAEDVTVMVNGVAAEVDNGRFMRDAVPLSLGPNTIVADVADRSGKHATHTITITRAAPGGRRLRVVSGDGQTGPVAELLEAPIVVVVEDDTGTPIADVAVLFEITDNDGVLEGTSPIAASADGRRVQVLTAADGTAAIDWTLGSHAGAGVNRLTITAAGVDGSVSVHASGAPGAGVNLFAHEGLSQVGAVGRPYLWPLSVMVADGMGNPVPDVFVTFHVTDGAGTFADGDGGGSATAIVTSNAKGIAEVLFTPGEPAGPGTQVVVATVAGSDDPEQTDTVGGVTFRGSAFHADPEGHTSLTGVIVDENQTPIPNVRVTSTPPSNAAAVTGPDGRFTLDGTPEGFVLLEFDGAGAVPDLANWHLTHMTFMANVVAGIVNQLDRPVYFLNLPGGTFVDGKEDVTLTSELVPGLALTIHKGTTVTFADGSHEGYIGVTQVSFDQAPMAPIDGLQPRLLVTIQPPGVTFDPPATFQIPNSEGFAPGEKVTMFSYDHSIEEFITIGTGSVSSDGTVIGSDPGVGVREGGWHSGSNPNPPGKAGNITAVLDIVPTALVSAKAIAGGSPSADTTWEFCSSGTVTIDKGPNACVDTAICTANVRPDGTAVAAAGKVKVVHRSTTSGQFAQATKEVTFCDAAPHKQKYSGSFTPSFIEDFLNTIKSSVSPFGCSLTPTLNITAEYESYDACCAGCPGVSARSGSIALGGNAGIEILCNIPYLSFPTIKTKYVTFDVGAAGGARGSASVKANFGFDRCYDPPRVTQTGSAELGIEGVLQLKAIIKAFTVEIANIVGEINTGIKGSLTLSNDPQCDPQARLDGQLCWTGFNLKYVVSSDALSQGFEGEYVLFPSVELLHGERCIDVPPPPAGVTGPGVCPQAPPPIPDPSCGTPTPPGGNTSSNGQSQGSSAYAGSCPSTPPASRLCRRDSDCQDGDVCNGTETCVDDHCVPGQSLLCPEDPGLECVDTRCDAVRGCVKVPHPERCGDSVGCTVDSCVVGIGCQHNPDSTRCDDHYDCTVDACDKVADCQHTPFDIMCNDDQPCTTEHCNAASGCEFVTDDSACNNDASCTNDTCLPFAGCIHIEDDRKCDDGVPCTDDRCDATADCKHTPDDSQCDDGVDCTSDTCDATLGCKAAQDDTKCDDGVTCTNDKCTTSGCQQTADNGKCGDGIACTDDVCDPVLDCQHNPDDGKCGDNRTCTIDACLVGTGCNHTEESCDDGDPCTADACAASCVHTPIAGCGGNGGGSGCVTAATCPGGGAPTCDGTQVTVSQCIAGRCDTQVVGCAGLPNFCRNDAVVHIDCGGQTCSETVVDDCGLHGQVCRNNSCQAP